jgi:hypothetical protein
MNSLRMGGLLLFGRDVARVEFVDLDGGRGTNELKWVQFSA